MLDEFQVCNTRPLGILLFIKIVFMKFMLCIHFWIHLFHFDQN